MTREEHLLVRAMEECAETAQRLSKALVFGLDQVQRDADDKPEQNPEQLTNRERVWREFVDLLAVMEMAGFTVPLTADLEAFVRYVDAKRAKQAKVERYLERSARCGTLHSQPPPAATESA